ncbi:hypothetical protein Tco_0822646 [Tanacetum coccineum]|uniref:Uncharacterized protein n=1 Tax=Tanacetum coccineum TaxID=301880 RepID=A0ABQ5AIP2_9ASTR
MSSQTDLLPVCTCETLLRFKEVLALLVEKIEFSTPRDLQELREELAIQHELEQEQQGLDALDSLTYHQLIAQYQVVGTSR